MELSQSSKHLPLSLTAFPRVTAISGILSWAMVPTSSPMRSLPSAPHPLMDILNAGTAWPSTVFEAPWRPMIPTWWQPQDEGHPEILNLGRYSPTPASRTAAIIALSSPLESRTPCWQIVPPMHDTDVSNRFRAPPSVASLTLTASSPSRLMMYRALSGDTRTSAPSASAMASLILSSISRGILNDDRSRRFERSVSGIVPGRFSLESEGLQYTDENGLKLYSRNLATGMKVFSVLKILVSKGYVNENTVLMLDEPEIHLHPLWINELAAIICILVKDLGVRIVMTTHNPQLLMALEGYSRDCGIGLDCYNLTLSDGGVDVEDVTGDLGPVYRSMSEPIRRANSIYMGE